MVRYTVHKNRYQLKILFKNRGIFIEKSITYPIGSLFVKVRFLLGLAWFIGIVLPCK